MLLTGQPVSLSAVCLFIWVRTEVRYAMALYNQHVCPVDNWVYNQSCEEELYVQSGPTLCCTLDNVPLISNCGTLPPESSFFSLICSTGSFMVMVIVLLRYAHVIEKHQNCLLNTAALSTGWICAAGLIMVGNFQVDSAKVLHYVGAGMAFPTSMLFVCLQSALTYRLAKTQGEYGVAHLRLTMSLLAFASLALSILFKHARPLTPFMIGFPVLGLLSLTAPPPPAGVFFLQDSFVLQHASAVFEWVFCVIVMLFYGTFAFEFAGMSGETMMVLGRGGALGPEGRAHKMEGGATPHPHAHPHPHPLENMSML
ncbi:Transmembrane protein 150A [Merluccius polli]|uniref:Transmembrane protein 150A n=1 Tax=Merluccius polli TaxID=89951 RepID=A0AA47MGL0_MERPO|nr:Transmembrane protein 150A [Merluccius polli]